VDELKSMGWSIERIIVRMKELAAEVKLSSWADAPEERRKLMDDAISWCIDRYYASAPEA